MIKCGELWGKCLYLHTVREMQVERVQKNGNKFSE